MKHVRNTTGGLLFQPYEWCTSKQIASFFSNLSKSQRVKNIDEGNHGIETEDEEPNIRDKNLELLQLVIEIQVQADHPILFQEHNLCHLATEGKVKTLRIDTLKKAFLSLNVEVTGFKARKDTFALPLDKYICTHRSKSCKYCHDRCWTLLIQLLKDVESHPITHCECWVLMDIKQRKYVHNSCWIWLAFMNNENSVEL